MWWSLLTRWLVKMDGSAWRVSVIATGGKKDKTWTGLVCEMCKLLTGLWQHNIDYINRKIQIWIIHNDCLSLSCVLAYHPSIAIFYYYRVSFIPLISQSFRSYFISSLFFSHLFPPIAFNTHHHRQLSSSHQCHIFYHNDNTFFFTVCLWRNRLGLITMLTGRDGGCMFSNKLVHSSLAPTSAMHARAACLVVGRGVAVDANVVVVITEAWWQVFGRTVVCEGVYPYDENSRG